MLVKFNRPGILGFKDVLIIPGVNDLSAEIVADMQDDEIIAGKFDRGELEIIDLPGVKTKAGASGVAALLKASDKNAVALAAQTVDMSILETWLSKEKRGVVKKAIKVQVAKIRNIKFRDSNDEKDKE